MPRPNVALSLALLLLLVSYSFAAPSCSNFINCLDCTDPEMEIHPALQCEWCDTTEPMVSKCRAWGTCAGACPSGAAHCYDSEEICPGSNSPPVVGAVTITPSPVLVGETFNCRATVADPNNDACTVTYKAWDSGSSEGSPDHSGATSCSGASWVGGKSCTAVEDINNFQLPGPVTCKIYANDGRGGTDSESSTALLECPAGEDDCSNLCVNLQTDSDNCGSCGNACPVGVPCVAGVCTCAGGNTLCPDGCKNLQTDPDNCGSCAHDCVALDCISGSCGCPVGESACDDGCQNLNTDSSNCGACGTVCPDTSTCQSGTCTCPAGGMICSDKCVDATVDMLNCGECGNVCTGDQVCNLGVCEDQTACLSDDDCDPGWACCNRICARPTCSSNSDCEDNNACTIDTCVSGGTCSAFCRHAAVTTCAHDDGCCPAGCSTTADSDCITACPSYCSGDVPGTACEQYVCFGSKCFRSYKKPCCGNLICEAGETTSSCGVDCTSTCGNGMCDATESKCTCPGECGTCTGKCADACMELQCQPDGCVCFPLSNCCGNGNCDSNETYANCPQDCAPRTVALTILAPRSSDIFMRGDPMNLTVNVTADGVKAVNATVSVDAFSSVYTLYDDGLHGDGNQYDGVYSNTVLVPSSAPDGQNTITFSAMKKRKKGTLSTTANIDASLDMSLSTQKNSYALGDNIEISGTLSKRGVPLGRSVKISLSLDGAEIYGATVSTAEGNFSYTYRVTLADPPGTWLVSASASDEQGNVGLASRQVVVAEPSDTGFFSIELAEPKPGAYARGQQVSVTVMLRHDGAPVENATVSFTSPAGAQVRMQDLGGGLYGAPYFIGWDDPVGQWKISVRAFKVTADGTQAGGAEGVVTITPATINLEIIEPSKNLFSIGESIQFVIKATYSDGTPAELPTASITVMGEVIPLTQKSRGIYEGSYKIGESTPDDIVVSLDIGDANGNLGQKKLAVKVEGTSPLYYVEKYPLFALILFMFLAGVVFTLGRAVYKSERLRRLEARQKELVELQKKLQVQYFKEGTVDKDSFYELSSKYDAELENVEKAIAGLGATTGAKK